MARPARETIYYAYTPLMTIYGYLRLSVQELDAGTSLASQQAEIQRYADSKGEQVEFFIDDGFSGRSGKRPEYQRLRRSLATSGLTAVVCRSVDRLGRNLRETLDFVAEASRHGVAFVATSSGVDTSTSQGLMFIQMMGVFAEAEAGAISERQVYSQAQRRKQGRSIGTVPYGFNSEHRSDGAYRVINQVQAGFLLMATESILAGGSVGAACRELNEAGSTTNKGKPWHATGLLRVLRNPSVAGLRSQRGVLLLNEDGSLLHDPVLEIIPLKVWRDLQEVLAGRSFTRTAGDAADKLLLSSLVKCGSCGSRMHKSKNGNARVYRCNAKITNVCVRPVSIAAWKLDAYVLDQLASLGHMPIVEMVTADSPDNILKRESLNLQIGETMRALTEASPDQITELAAKLLALKESLVAVPSASVETYRETGESFASMLAVSPEVVVHQALVEVIVHRPLVRNSQTVGPDRVHLVWREGPEEY